MAEPHAQLFMAYTHGAPAPCPFESGCVSWVSWTHHLHIIIMFFNKNTAYIAGIDLNSTAVDGMLVNPWRGTASVQFKNGGFYNYENVSRRACVQFMLDPAHSLGKFVNNVLKDSRVRCYGSAA